MSDATRTLLASIYGESRWDTPRPGHVTVGTCGDHEGITEQEA
jgi:hypothetical protein